VGFAKGANKIDIRVQQRPATRSMSLAFQASK
jgi:hypothetical protein